MTEKNQWDLERLKIDAKCFVFAKVGDQVHSVYISASNNWYDVEDIYELAQSLTPRPTSTTIRKPSTDDWIFIEKHYDDDLAVGSIIDTPDEQQRVFNTGAVVIRMPEDYLIIKGKYSNLK